MWPRNALGTFALVALLIGSSACTTDDDFRETKQSTTRFPDAESPTQLYTHRDADCAGRSEPDDGRNPSSSERDAAHARM